MSKKSEDVFLGLIKKTTIVINLKNEFVLIRYNNNERRVIGRIIWVHCFPTTWYQYEQVSYRTLWWGAINYRSSSGGGNSWDKTRTTSAQAYYYYFTKNELPTIPVPQGDLVGRDYLNDFTRVFTIAPESRVGGNWEGQAGGYGTTVAIAPDKITPYMGEIYEFVRYSFTF